MQKSVQERNEQVKEYHSVTHTHTHTHTHGCNSAAGQEKEHWEHPGPLVYPPGTIAFPPPKIKVTLPCVCQSLSRVGLFRDPRDCTHQTPLSVELPRPEHWSGSPSPSADDRPNPGIKPGSPTLQADSLPSEPPGKPLS